MGRLVEKVSDKYILIVLVAVSFIIHHSWFSFDVFSFSDYGFKFAETLADYSDLSAWVYRQGVGSPDILLWRAPLLLFQSFFGHLGFGLNVADKFTIMWMWIVISVCSSYLLVRKISGSKMGGILGSLVFCYNTYFISINSVGHFNISVASAFGVFSFFYLIKVYESNKFSYLILSSLLLSISGFYDLRVLYMMVIIYGMYFFYNVVLDILQKKHTFLKLLKKNLTIFIIFGLLNTYWILPTFVSGSLESNAVLSRGLFGDQFWSIDAALSLFHPFWNGKELLWFERNNVPIHYFILPVLAVMGLFSQRKNKIIIFFGLLGGLGIFLAKQTDFPFGDVYVWLYARLPGFSSFREATKFYIYIAIGYSVLVGAFYSTFLNSKKNGVAAKLLEVLFVLLLFIPLIPNVIPIFSGKIGSTYIPRIVSEDSKKVNSLINQQGDYFRTLVIPTYPHSWTYTNLHPRISLVNSIDNFWGGSYATTAADLSVNEKMESLFSKNATSQLLDQYSIKYVSIPRREDVSKDDFFLYYGKDKDYYQKMLIDIPYLKKADMGLAETDIYENTNFRPHIYITRKPETVNENVPYEQVRFERGRSLQYKVYIENMKSIVYLNLTEQYHSKWGGILGNLNIDSLGSVLPGRLHLKTDSGINSFEIDPEYIKKNFSKDKYQLNKDGSISFQMTILFFPNLFFILGSAISLFTIVLLTAILIMIRLRPNWLAPLNK